MGDYIKAFCVESLIKVFSYKTERVRFGDIVGDADSKNERDP